jgi:hypothetical protein
MSSGNVAFVFRPRRMESRVSKSSEQPVPMTKRWTPTQVSLEGCPLHTEEYYTAIKKERCSDPGRPVDSLCAVE